MTARDKALHTIVKLRTLADHPNTPPNEAEAAQARIKALQDKHGIGSFEQYTGPTFDDLVRTAEQARQRKARFDAERRARAQAEWLRQHQNNDNLGRPIPRSGPMRDPFDEALRRDGRTHADKQQDMQNAHKHQKCMPKLSFFDIGGEPRKRNAMGASCVLCGGWLAHGDGAEFSVGYACCDRVPGPRKKKSAQSE